METLKQFLIAVFTHKRMKSLYWAVGAMVVPVLGDVVVEQATTFDAPGWLVVGVGLVLAQVTKAINTKTQT